MASQSDTRGAGRSGAGTKEEVKPWLCRLPASLDKKLARRAFDEGRHKADIVRDAVTEYLAKK